MQVMVAALGMVFMISHNRCMLDSLPNPVACNKHNMVIDSPDRGLIVCGGLWVRDRDECGVRADGRDGCGCARGWSGQRTRTMNEHLSQREAD